MEGKEVIRKMKGAGKRHRGSRDVERMNQREGGSRDWQGWKGKRQ